MRGELPVKTIQKLFERLAGITQDELDRIDLAAKVFQASSPINIADLERPACWRRPRRYRVL